MLILYALVGFVVTVLVSFGLWALLKPQEPRENRKLTPEELQLKRQLYHWN
jgi:hypothetical protein